MPVSCIFLKIKSLSLCLEDVMMVGRDLLVRNQSKNFRLKSKKILPLKLGTVSSMLLGPKWILFVGQLDSEAPYIFIRSS